MYILITDIDNLRGNINVDFTLFVISDWKMRLILRLLGVSGMSFSGVKGYLWTFQWHVLPPFSR